MEFPGSLTLQQETFLSVAKQYLHSAWRHGFRNFLVLNAHGGNQGVCQVLLEQFGTEHPDSQIVVATWWRVAADALLALNETGPGGVGHACEFETSLMLHIAPELVHMDAIEPRANVPTYEWAEADLLPLPARCPVPHDETDDAERRLRRTGPRNRRQGKANHRHCVQLARCDSGGFINHEMTAVFDSIDSMDDTTDCREKES